MRSEPKSRRAGARYQSAPSRRCLPVYRAEWLEPRVLLSNVIPSNVVVLTSSGNDTITLKQDLDHVHIDWTTSAGLTGQVPISNDLLIVDTGAADTIALDSTNGSPVPHKLSLGSNTYTITGYDANTLSGGQTVDMGDGSVYIAYPSGSLLPAVQKDLRSAFSGGAWTGTGITSFAARVDPALGIADVDSAQGGVPGQPQNSIYLKAVNWGDSNLDGTTNLPDMLTTVRNFGRTGADWMHGNFDYTGTVGLPSFQLLSRNFGNATYTVTSTATSGPGSLADALVQPLAGANGKLYIRYAVPQTDPGYNATTGQFTLSPTANLPAVQRGVFIDGLSQTGSSPYAPSIVLNGSAITTTPTTGLQITPGAGVLGMGVTRFGTGIHVGPSSLPGSAYAGFMSIFACGNGFAVDGNAPFGLFASLLSGNTGRGIVVNATTAGATSASQIVGNVVIGNASDGIAALSGASSLVLRANCIGTDYSGSTGLGNRGDGINLNGSSNDTIGGSAAGDGNVIAANRNGINIQNSAAGNLVKGNFIGTNPSGASGLGNTTSGVLISFAGNDTIGGSAAGDGNVISGNGSAGVNISGPTATGNLIQGNFIGTDPTGSTRLPNFDGVVVGGSNNTVGGIAPGARNILSGNNGDGVRVTGNANLIQGNSIGTNALGTAPIPNSLYGVIVNAGGAANTIGGTASGDGNLISGNSIAGIETDAGSSSTLILGNDIGSNAALTSAVPNATGIIIASGASGVVIGGPGTGAGNVIAGNGSNGITLQSNGTLVEGNWIGLTPGGSALPNGGAGVLVSGGLNNTIGGTASGDGNFIANNRAAGIAVVNIPGANATGNSILGNSIFSNGGLGIDLNNDGVTLNTPGGPHTGPNNLQNFPVLTSAAVGASGTVVAGTLNSTPGAVFRIEFFASPAADPSGYGQGKTFLGFTLVTTNAAGNATFTAVLPAVPAGNFLTATAIDSAGNTSEFAQSLQVSVTPSVSPSLDASPRAARKRLRLQH